ncbi:MAG: glucose PTS transporter subunit IIA [Lachnospiraceae bacterium]|nr:glucose PTS transporter subunit IIA [Lachnospiraceae bacterium]
MKNQLFGIFQRIGQSFMLPIAVLPIAGVLLGIGTSFTSSSMIRTYGLESVLGEGTFLHAFFMILSRAGSSIFNNLPLIFAVGIAIGMAHMEKEVAALSSVIAYFVMHASVNAVLTIQGIILPSGEPSADVLSGMITSSVGIYTLQMGVFGGIIVGLGVAFLHNRFHRIELPNAISFFGGNRFVPIISSVVYVAVGILMAFIWPVVQQSIYAIGGLVTGTGYIGTFIFGIVKRALLPFGLHHVFYMPFWQTGVGGSMEVAGRIVEGGQNIIFAQLADPSTTHFSAEACRFFSGEFIFMIFGLPGAALAMYHCAKTERKKQVGGLLLSAALASMLTGITEPIEFSFLFVAPILYVVQVILAGAAYMIAHILNIAVGLTFSGGMIDLIIFGILQGNDKTNWIMIVIVGIIYFFLYYAIFKFLILRLNLKTPGREDDGEVTRLYTKKHMQAKRARKDYNKIKDQELTIMISRALGGKDNFYNLDCCATRLRCSLKNPDLVSEKMIRQTGSSGILRQGNSIQIIYGPNVTIIKSDLELYLESDLSDDVEIIAVDDLAEGNRAKEEHVRSPIKGKIIPLNEIDDSVFSAEMLGKGFAVIPEDGNVYAPVTGYVTAVFDTKHAIGFASEFGAEILVHIGINTVQLGGKYFDVMVEPGQHVETGELIATFDRQAIEESNFSVATPVVVVNSDTYSSIEFHQNSKNVLNLIK